MSEQGQRLGRYRGEEPGRIIREGIYASHEGDAIDSIFDLVVSGKLPIESKFTETSLATQLGFTGRTPIVREALQHLVREEVAVLKPQVGYWIRRVPTEEATLIYGLRGAVEWFIVGPLAQKPDPRQLRPLMHTLGDMEIATDESDLKEFTLLDTELHRMLPEAVGVSDATAPIRIWTNKLLIYRTENPLKQDEMQNLTSNYRGLLRCLRSGDREGAGAIISRDLKTVAQSQLGQIT